jgi:hypothetical protein
MIHAGTPSEKELINHSESAKNLSPGRLKGPIKGSNHKKERLSYFS